MKHRVEPATFNFANGPTGDQGKEKQMNNDLRIQQQQEEDKSKDSLFMLLLNGLMPRMSKMVVDPEVVGAHSMKGYALWPRECFK
jgi:hypothetical protein